MTNNMRTSTKGMLTIKNETTKSNIDSKPNMRPSKSKNADLENIMDKRPVGFSNKKGKIDTLK